MKAWGYLRFFFIKFLLFVLIIEEILSFVIESRLKARSEHPKPLINNYEIKSVLV